MFFHVLFGHLYIACLQKTVHLNLFVALMDGLNVAPGVHVLIFTVCSGTHTHTHTPS